MKLIHILIFGVTGMAATLGCVRSYCSAKKSVNEMIEEIEASTQTPGTELPHDYPPELVYPDAWFTYGATGMMRAEAHPESHAHFMTYQPRDSVLAFFRSVEGWEMRFEERDSADVYTFAMTQLGELADFQFVAELVPSTIDEGKPVIHINIVYGPGIGIRYPDYFYEYGPPD